MQYFTSVEIEGVAFFGSKWQGHVDRIIVPWPVVIGVILVFVFVRSFA